MIQANNISKYYIVQGKKKEILKNLSLTIKPGERFALMGRNGAGKSTLLRLLCGLEKPNKGEIRISSKLSWPVGVAGGFIGNLTGKENIKFVCRLFNENEEQTRERINFVRDFTELGDYLDMPLQTYSSGMRARLSFGLSMAFDFDFYIVDEALSVGDVTFKKKCKEVFTKRLEKKGIIMVSHGVKTIQEFCDRGIFLDNGHFVQSEKVTEIIKLYQALAR